MCTYIGEDWVYKNLVPPMDVELKHGQQYDIHIESDSQMIYVNGVPIVTKPAEVRVVCHQSIRHGFHTIQLDL